MVIDVSGDAYFLHTANNKLLVEKNDEIKAEIPFADIHSIVCHEQGCRYSDAFFKQCLDNNVPVVFCDAKHVPQGMLLSMNQHSNFFERQMLQINATIPRKKQAWQRIIQEKLKNQAYLLHQIGSDAGATSLEYLSNSVSSGDPDNKEAQGAKIFFSCLFGSSFTRSNDDDIINGYLNYGYTILRSAMARAIVGCGLNPSFGVFHSSQRNAFCLTDDLMEPMRPMVDALVVRLSASGLASDFGSAEKKQLMSIIQQPVFFGSQHVELGNALTQYVLSYIGFLEKQKVEMQFPNFNEIYKC